MAGKKLCGYVAIVGRPNVGKSTLLNHLMGQKLSITSRKPQTTRHRILGIKTTAEIQIIYVDTPGIHQNNIHKLNNYMNRAAITSLFDVDIIVFMVEALHWYQEDDWILQKVIAAKVPVILLVNKVDKVADKAQLLPYLEKVGAKMDFAAIMPVSALKKLAVTEIENVIQRYLPESEHYFYPDQITDRSERFLSAEIIREKLMRQLGQELPYATTVAIDSFEMKKGIIHIIATIYVEKIGQKAIVIGEKGERLKKIASAARIELEKMLDNKVFLKVWVKEKRNWSDDAKALRSLGYD